MAAYPRRTVPILNLFRCSSPLPRQPSSPVPIARQRKSLRAQGLQPQRRVFSTTIGVGYPRKDSQERESINTEATEYSKSGTDDAVARQSQAAFNPSITKPEQEKKVAGKDGNSKGTVEGGNPLEVSPANQEISKPRGQQEGGAEKSAEPLEKRKSGFGEGKKGGS